MNKLLTHLTEIVVSEAMFGIAVFESDGSSIYLNKMAAQLLGCTELKIHHLKPASGEARSQFLPFSPEFLRHDGLYQDILLNRPDGQTFIANVGIRSVTVDRHALSILMFQDVTLQKKLQRDITAKQTEIKAAYEELLKQNRQLKELDTAKNKFIAITTHELRTPLAAMVASAEILKLGLYDTPEQMREFIDIINEQGQQLSELVNDILDFTKIQAGKMDFYIEYQDVLPVLQNLIRNFGDMAQNNQVTIVDDGLGVDAWCFFDEMRIKQVFSNIINNAIKYNRPGGSLTIRLEETKELVKIFFKDTGKGIAEDQYNKVFNEFETIEHVSEHHKGTGLGMPISRKLIEGMGGKLEFTSKLGYGTTFWVEIPKEKVLSGDVYRPRPEKSGDLAA